MLLTVSVSSCHNTCIRLTQENLMKFQLQNVYLIYTGLIFHAILNLVYPKEHIYYILLTCGITLYQTWFISGDEVYMVGLEVHRVYKLCAQ